MPGTSPISFIPFVAQDILAYGIGAGSDMLKPLAIAVIGALTLSVLLSLIATPTVYFVMRTFRKRFDGEGLAINQLQ
jgi:Cu/Ag efflux pump CusA